MLACIRCGLCLTSCPTYVLSLHEAEGPRGRVGMARALAEGHLQRHAGPGRARAELPGVRRLFGGLPGGRAHGPAAGGAALGAWPSGTSASRIRAARCGRRVRLAVHGHGAAFGCSRGCCGCTSARACAGWRGSSASCACWASSDCGAPAARYAGDVRHAARRDLSGTGDAAETRRAVAFFAGCVMSTALADIDRATIRVLQRAGFDVRTQQPGLLRRPARARRRSRLARSSWPRRNIAAFEATDGPIVVNSAGCGAMLKDYAHHLRNDPAWAERARGILGARPRPERSPRRAGALPMRRRAARQGRLPGRLPPAARPAHQPPAARPAAPHPRPGARRDRRSRAVLRQRGRLQRHQSASSRASCSSASSTTPWRRARRHRHRQPRLPAAAAERPCRARQPTSRSGTSPKSSTRRPRRDRRRRSRARSCATVASSTRRPSCAPTPTTRRS